MDPVELYAHKLPQTSGFTQHYMMLYAIIIGMEAKNVFEFGCGYSTRVLLDAVRQTGGTLTTNDVRDIKDTGNDPNMITENQDVWRYLQKRSDEALRDDVGKEAYDVILHDGAHEAPIVMRDIRKIVRHLKQDGLLLIHDTNHPSFPYLPWAVRLGLFPYRYELCTVPYGFGLTIVRLKSNLGNGRVTLQWKKQSPNQSPQT